MPRKSKSPTTPEHSIASSKAFIVNHEDEVLLLRKNNGEFDIPGGHPEPGENHLEALLREAKEEIGQDIGSLAMWLAHVEVENPKRGNGRSRAFFVVHAGDALDLDPDSLGPEHRDVQWVPVRKAGSKLDHPAQIKAYHSIRKQGLFQSPGTNDL
jgi:8-oxo-dGTP diphosphatase